MILIAFWEVSKLPGEKHMSLELIRDTAAGVISGIILLFIGYHLASSWFVEPDFTLSIGETNKIVTGTGVSLDNNVTMHNTYNHRKYKASVALIALERGKSQLPRDITIEFKPSFKINLGKNNSITSEMAIIIEENPERGDHLIDIFGLGEDGKERKCSFYLYIK
jgi:hypothetical protein